MEPPIGFGLGPLVVGSVAATAGVPAAFGLAATVAFAAGLATLLGPRVRGRVVGLAG